MPAPAAAVLANITAAAVALLPDTGTVTRYSETDDGAGGTRRSYTPLAGVACRVGLLSAKQRAAYEQAGGVIVNAPTYAVSVPVTTDVTVRDRVVVDGRTFEVAFVPRTSLGTLLVLHCREVGAA